MGGGGYGWRLTNSASSSSAKPLLTAFIRIAYSIIPAGLGNARIERRDWRASTFLIHGDRIFEIVSDAIDR